MAPTLAQSVGRWSTAEIHDTVAAIARQPAYATPLRKSLLGRALAYLVARFGDLLDLMHGSGNFRIVAVAAVALIALAIVGRIVVARQLDVMARRAGASREVTGGRRDYWNLSRELAAAGEYDAASHAVYAAVIDALSRSGAVTFHSSKTSGDYARELRRRGSPAFQDFRTFGRLFDRIVYGAPSVNRETYAELARAAQSVPSVRDAA
jgi:hypothetical protein